MKSDTLRVSVKLEPETDPDLFLAELERVLGRRLLPVQRLHTAPILSFWVTAEELKQICKLPGISHVAEEPRRELPPRPSRQERE